MVVFVGSVRLASRPAEPMPDGSGYFLYHPLERKLGWRWIMLTTPFLVVGTYLWATSGTLGQVMFILIPCGLAFWLGIHYLKVAKRRLEVTAFELRFHGY